METSKRLIQSLAAEWPEGGPEQRAGMRSLRNLTDKLRRIKGATPQVRARLGLELYTHA